MVVIAMIQTILMDLWQSQPKLARPKKKKCIFLAISTEACKTPQKMGGGGFGNLNRGLQGHKKKEK